MSLHARDRLGLDDGRGKQPSATRLHHVGILVPGEALSHLASTGVADANEQDSYRKLHGSFLLY